MKSSWDSAVHLTDDFPIPMRSRQEEPFGAWELDVSKLEKGSLKRSEDAIMEICV
jgi:hypothetical protein